MHITIVDQTDGSKSVLCIDRETQTCSLLTYSSTTIGAIITIAKAMKVKRISVIIPLDPNATEHFANGWKSVSARSFELENADGT